MNALTQYIDLFKEHSHLINENAARVMNFPRTDALKSLESKHLPKKGAENYENIDFSKILEHDYGLNIKRVNFNINASAPFRCGLPNITPSLYFLRNDLYSASSPAEKFVPEGAFIGSIREFCDKFPEIASKHYAKIADIDNPIVALNTLFAQDGIAIWLKKGVKLEKPVQIVNVLENGMPLMAVRRFLIIAEEDTKAEILMCDHTQTENVPFVALQTMEVYVGKNASVNIYEMEESTLLTSRLSSFYAEMNENSRLLADTITLFNGTTRNEYYVNIGGKGAELKLLGMAIEDLNRHIDILTRVEHNAEECHTDELFKYVVDEEASGSFAGLVKVNRGACKTEAFQSNRNIVGSDDAKIFSKPQLEIYEDDVKCSHGSATGQLDEMQVFYMQTRGIPENEAKLLLKQAFMSDVTDAVALPGLKERLHILIEKRFSGELSNCLHCNTGCHG